MRIYPTVRDKLIAKEEEELERTFGNLTAKEQACFRMLIKTMWRPFHAGGVTNARNGVQSTVKDRLAALWRAASDLIQF